LIRLRQNNAKATSGNRVAIGRRQAKTLGETGLRLYNTPLEATGTRFTIRAGTVSDRCRPKRCPIYRPKRFIGLN